MAARSKLLAAGNTAAGGPFLVYTCPSGHVTLIKGIGTLNTYAGFNRLYVELWRSSAQLSIVAVPCDAYGTLGESQNVVCWLAMQAGDQLKVDQLHANQSYWIAGAELVLAP